jgi:hypothetical protein
MIAPSDLRAHESQPMAEPEVEAAWRAEFRRSGATQFRDADCDNADKLKTPAAFRWRGDEAEARRLQDGHIYHYARWMFLIALAAVIAGLIAVCLALLR